MSKDHETKTMLCDQQLEVGGGKEGFGVESYMSLTYLLLKQPLREAGHL